MREKTESYRGSLEESPYVLKLLSSARNNIQKIKDIKLLKKSEDKLIKQISQSGSGGMDITLAVK
jgi:hypothetical protein